MASVQDSATLQLRTLPWAWLDPYYSLSVPVKFILRSIHVVTEDTGYH
jgi:hypothetical protein